MEEIERYQKLLTGIENLIESSIYDGVDKQRTLYFTTINNLLTMTVDLVFYITNRTNDEKCGDEYAKFLERIGKVIGENKN